jgi:lipopolysaccharide/colanic/teichoic acid biosynthesis glycosyltransferase
MDRDSRHGAEVGGSVSSGSATKRALDLALAVSGLLLLAPLLLVTATAIKASSPGPIIYRQGRSGLNGRVFVIYKFRTMHEGTCDDVLSPRCRQATENDPRVTPLGRLLRRASVDELPQLLNVLKGEMSIVGPRPHAVAHDAYYSLRVKGYEKRYRARPGLTGLAQVMGYRGETKTIDDMQKRIDADNLYIENWSMRLDLVIIAETLAMLIAPFRACSRSSRLGRVLEAHGRRERRAEDGRGPRSLPSRVGGRAP